MGELDFENVVFGYGGNALFNGFSASFAKEQISCIVGPNGCGKSTLAKLAMGLIKPASGRVLIQGRDVASLNPRERARRLGVLVQQQEAPMMTVRELAACGRFPHHGPLSRLDETDAQCIGETLSLAGVYDLRDRPLRSLSGGQRQRARMAMVLAQDTPVVLLDEPTSFMDAAACFDMMRLVRRVRERGKTVIAVIHDLNLALSVADAVFVMERGRLAAQGAPAKRPCRAQSSNHSACASSTSKRRAALHGYRSSEKMSSNASLGENSCNAACCAIPSLISP